MKLTPENIQEHIEEIGIKEANSILIEWILSSNEIETRKQALVILKSVDNGKNFIFLENIFLSDENSDIQKISGTILKEKYLNHKGIVSLFEFSLSKLRNWELKFIAIEILNEIKSNRANKIIKEFLRNTIEENFSDRISEFPEEIFNEVSDTAISDSILEICFQFIMHDYYEKECGYHVTIRNGFIVLLESEGHGIKKISDIVGINRLRNLEHLKLNKCLLETLEGIQAFKSLKSLKLSYNYLKRIEYLDELIQLEELDFSGNYIEKIENLECLTQLRILNLEENSISEIKGLNTLEKLAKLNLGNNKIKEIKGLSELKQLKRLSFANNQIEVMQNLKGLRDLNYLNLKANKISKIEGLEDFTNLRGLNLCQNQIKKIENLEPLELLVKLELSNNNIQKIQGVSTLKKLQGLFLDNNNITEIEGLDGLNDLITLFLKDNQITEFKELNLRSLRYLFLNDNPLTPDSHGKYIKRTTRFP